MKAKRLLNVLTLLDSRYIAELYEEDALPRRRAFARVWLIAAIIAIMLVMVGCVAYMLSLQDLQLTDKPHFVGYEPDSTEKTDTISLQGFVGTPNYLAAKEWLEFRKSYDPDHTILSGLTHEEEMAVPEAYLSYGCYTEEMTAKVDEICGKYGLNKQGVMLKVYSLQQLYEAVGIEGILRENTKAEVNIDPTYFYKSGTFMLSGNTILLGENSPWHHTIEYQFYSVMKTDFDDVFLNVGDIEHYEQWEYTTWNGMQSLLAISSETALIIVDNGTAFISINILNPMIGDAEQGEQMMTGEALETFADTFDFSIAPQTISDENWEKAKLQEKAELDAYNAAQEEWLNSDANPANQKGIADYIQHLIDYERTSDLYYGLYDLNRDGSYELLVGTGESEFGQVVAFADGSAQVTTQGFFEGMYLCEGNVIEVTDVILGWEGQYRGWYYEFDALGNANLVDSVMMDENGYYENPWFSDPEGYHFTDPWMQISEDEYNAVRAKYPRVEVKLKPISEFPFE